MPLSDLRIKSLKPQEKRFREPDSDGLYLEVTPTGKKHWLFRYTYDGKRNWVKVGEYPLTSLQEAREKRNGLKKDLLDGRKPDLSPARSSTPTFRSVALDFLEAYKTKISSKKEKTNAQRRLEMHVFPYIGDMPIADITSVDVLQIARMLHGRGTHEIARRVVQIAGRVFRHGILHGYCKIDPTYGIQGAIPAPPAKHFASITEPRQVGGLLRAIDAYPQNVIRTAMQFSALTFARPGEIRHAEWAEVDVEKAEWRVPAEKMKMRRPHIVPLARQALDVLEAIRPTTGHGRYIFPNGRSPHGDRAMSENGVLVALRSMGYTKDQMTAHGFRSMASTLLNENGFNRDWIERQLAHVEGNSVRAAYNYADYLPERRKMMQWWADYLDELRNGLE